MNRPPLTIDRSEAREDSPCAESLELRVEALEFDLELARRVHARLEAETQRLHQHIAAIDADRASLRNRLDERERYLGAILSSVGWKIIQAVRGLFGRRW